MRALRARTVRSPPRTWRLEKRRIGSGIATPRLPHTGWPVWARRGPPRRTGGEPPGTGGGRAPDASRAEAYRLSLEGFRKLERSDVSGAEALLARSVTLDPNDGVARYRYGRALLSKKNDAAALEQFEHAIRRARECPAPIAAAAYLEAARVHERLAHREQA